MTSIIDTAETPEGSFVSSAMCKVDGVYQEPRSWIGAKGGRGLSVSERQSRLCSIVFQTNPHRNEYSLFYSSSLLSVSLSR